MAQINLTEGAIAMLSSGGVSPESDVHPVLQVADVRLVNSQSQSSNERYRILLSDGSFTQQGMLATQRNDLVKSEKLLKGSVVKLNQFVCNLIQNRMIIIIIDLEVLVEKCDPIGEPRPYPTGSSIPGQPMHQTAGSFGNHPSYGAGSAPRPNVSGGMPDPPSGGDRNAGSHSYSSPVSGNMGSGAPVNNYVRPPQLSYNQPPQSPYNQPPPVFANRGPMAKNEAPPRIIPIAALNPYQGRWTIKARVTAKGNLRHYNNARGDGKVFSFDLLDSDGGEIRVTCFNAVADHYYPQIEIGRVYMITRGTLKPAQKNFNHLNHDHEIVLDNTSAVQPCFEEDKSIPQHQFHFRSIIDLEGLENNSIVDVVGVVSSISPSSSIMRKNGTEILKRTLQLKDMSGRSVELTMWGNFCNAEGQTLQNMRNSGIFPVLAVKSGRVSDFNGKSVGTISNSQLFIEPDFPEAQKLKAWFENNGKSTSAISISRETNMVRADAYKTVSQIKDERLGTSEKPDWVTVPATLTFIKLDNFCYTACPIMIGDRPCNKKVTNNGDGKWRCDRCDQVVDECDFRYILQMQIQDHTGLAWVTAFQEGGEEIMGISAKDLYNVKHVEQNDEKFAELIRGVLFTKFLFKLKVKEEIFSDEQRVKSIVVKAEKVNFQTDSRYLLDLIAKFKEDNPNTSPLKSENIIPTSGTNMGALGAGSRESLTPAMNYGGNNSNVARNTGVSASQMSSYAKQYGASGLPSTEPSTMHMSGPGKLYGGSFGNAQSTGGSTGECYKCHQLGHWARECPGTSNTTVRASGGGASGECFKCHQTGHWARDCPGTSNVHIAPNKRIGGF